MRLHLTIWVLIALLPGCDDDQGDLLPEGTEELEATSCQRGDLSVHGRPCCSVPPLERADCPDGWDFRQLASDTTQCILACDPGMQITRVHHASGALKSSRDSRPVPDIMFSCPDGAVFGDWVRGQDLASDPSECDPPPQMLDCSDTRKNCEQMHGCWEAQYYLEECGWGELDHDSDGIPCEEICDQ